MSNNGDLTPQGHYIQANGLEIYYEEYGTGAPLLLLHGGTLTSHSWQAHATQFAQQHRVIAPDSRGHGRTKNPSNELSYRLMADDMAALIQALDLNKPAICGFSDGAQIVLELGMHYPTLPQSLVVAGAFFKFSEEYCSTLKEWGLEAAGIVDFDKVEKNLAGLLAGWKTNHAPLGGPDYWRTLIHQISTMWWTPLDYTAQDFQQITVPTLVLLGDRDTLIPVEQAVEMYRFIPDAELAILPGATHGATVYGTSGVNQIFMNIVLDFFLRHNVQSTAGQ